MIAGRDLADLLREREFDVVVQAAVSWAHPTRRHLRLGEAHLPGVGRRPKQNFD